MNVSEITILVVVTLAIVIAYSSIRIANENERFAIFVMGRFWKFKGPGLVFKAGTMKLIRLKIGDLGVVTGPEFVRFGESDVPVSQASEFHIGDSVRILSFGEKGPFLARSDEAPIQRCPKCGHEY
jgi:hypothetical protein